MSDSGTELRNNNEKIVKLMALLRRERDEVNYLIQKQQEEKIKIENEIERLTFKLSLLMKSLAQRLQAQSNYDKTIKEIEGNYSHLVDESSKLLAFLNKEVHDLEEIMDKKIGTGSVQGDVEQKMDNSSVEEDMNKPSETDTQERKSNASDKSSNGQISDKQKVDYEVPPIKRGDESDAELQSYREAYGKQHGPPSPPLSISGSYRRGSNGRKANRRKSEN